MDFLQDVIKAVGGDYTRLAQDIDEDESYVDTGSLLLNALVSGTLFGGVSSNKITTFSGLQGSGKCARGTEKITIYADSDTIKKIKSHLEELSN
jgi:RecA/RadA recombinase